MGVIKGDTRSFDYSSYVDGFLGPSECCSCFCRFGGAVYQGLRFRASSNSEAVLTVFRIQGLGLLGLWVSLKYS